MTTAAKNAFDVIVLGAGAAGLMCALTAAQRGRRVLVLERGETAGAKILVSGGGRCNFSNLDVAPERFLSANPDFCRSALGRYGAHDFIAMVERHGIAYHEKTLGQLFCDGSARAIVAMLLDECGRGREGGHVEVRLAQSIGAVTRGDQFSADANGGSVTARALVLATGGLSIPKMGATGFSYDLAKRFGLGVIETRPGLVPFKVAVLAKTAQAALAGVALDVVAGKGARTFREAMLFTHCGLSGPAILQISSYWQEGESVTVDMLPGRDAAAWLLQRKRARPRSLAQTVLAEAMPHRVAAALAGEGLPAGDLANIPDKVLAAFGSRLNAWGVKPDGTEGYAKAEVTTGGIDTAALSQRTMEARAVPGLYAIGEAVDVTGWLGGYNFQWAWSSGWAAGQAV